MKLTIYDANPIIESLKKSRFCPKLVGSIATKGSSDNDIDILLPIELQYNNENMGELIRNTSTFLEYNSVMEKLGFKLIIAPPFAEIDTWKKENILVDIWFKK